MKKVIIIFSSIFAILIASFAIDQYYRLFVRNIVSLDDEPHLIYIYPNTSLDSLTNILSEQFQISSHWNWQLHCRLLKFRHPKTGCYKINPSEGDLAVIRRIRNGEQTPVEVTFNRIRTRQQLAKRLADQLQLDSASIASRLCSEEYMAQFGLNLETAVCLFIPNTYELYWTISPDRLFERMKTEYQLFWTPARQNKAKKIGLSQSQVQTLASIVESETNKDFEYPIIAGLYLNRLRKGMPLQACPTIIFAWQDFSMRRVLKKHLEIDSPYNTYKRKGLPPGPIRVAKPATIDAVLNYTPSDYLFMCASADFDGTNHFSSSYKQHAAYARAYQAELNRRKIIK
ncbi:MAG: endolytic transglycosylase MltG [Paludibacteraceae bacterium]|nr:endolytic transglycosylase MltG [Paludibacteraceae bacterium]